jgi:hypothetical protein
LRIAERAAFLGLAGGFPGFIAGDGPMHCGCVLRAAQQT